jgi:hypothetical protein
MGGAAGKRGAVGTALGLVLAAVAAGGCEPPPCLPPYPPAIASDSPGTPGWPAAGVTWRPAVAERSLDTDGDGTVDEVTVGPGLGDPLTVRRGSGELALHTGSDPAWMLPPGPAVEVDGDGRADVVVRVSRLTGDVDAYLVRGSTPDGTHDLAHVGVRLVGWTGLSSARPSGDVDGDGVDDLVFDGVGTRPDGSAFEDALIHSGAALAAVAPGGTSPEPVRLGALLVGTLPAGPRTSAVAVLDRSIDHYDMRVWFGGASAAFTTAGSGVFPPGAYQPSAQLADGPGGEVWLTLEAYGRQGNGGWAWDLRRPCGTATPAPPGPPAL